MGESVADDFSETRKVAKNTFFLTTADLTSKLFFFLFFLTASRHLQAEGFGILSFSFSFVNLLNLFTDFGMGFYLTREVARRKELTKFYLANTLGIKLFLSGFAILILFLASFLLNLSPKVRTPLYLISPLLLFYALWLVEHAIFRAYEKMEYIGMGRVFYSLFLFVGGYSLKIKNLGVNYFALLYLIAIVLAFFFSLYFLVKYFAKISFRFHLQSWLMIFKNSLPFGLSAVFVTFYYWNNATFLLKWKGEEIVGWFNAPYRLVLSIATLGIAFSESLYPLFAKLSISPQTNRFQKILGLSLRYIILFILPISFSFFLFSKEVILFLFGKGYLPSISGLKILIWWPLLIYLNGLASSFFNATDRAQYVAFQAGISAGTNLLLNLTLIKPFGLSGAGISLLAAELVGFIFLFFRLHKIFPGFNLSYLCRIFQKPLFATLLPIFVSPILRKAGLGGLFLYLLLYLAFLFLTKGFSSEDVKFLKRVIFKQEL